MPIIAPNGKTMKTLLKPPCEPVLVVPGNVRVIVYVESVVALVERLGRAVSHVVDKEATVKESVGKGVVVITG